MTLYKWSQTASADASADSTINWAEGQAPSSINDSARAMMAAIAKWRDDITGILVAGGTSTAYTITSNQTITSNVDGFTVQFTPGSTNSGATTLSVDSQAAKPLRFLTGVNLPAGSLISGSLYQATYRAATQEWLLHGFDASVYATPIGAAIDYFGSTAPNSSFVLAYGQAISRTTYASLFSLLGTTYGSGDGSSTFNIPDLRGRIIAGKDDMGGSAASRLTSTYFGTSAAALGAVGGSESHTLVTGEIPSHTHANSLTDPGHTHTTSNGSQDTINNGAASPATVLRFVGSGLTFLNNAVTGILINNAASGGGSAHKNVQPTIIANKLIRII